MVTEIDQDAPKYDSPELVEIGSFADVTCGGGSGYFDRFFHVVALNFR
ncbi:lasso RiPP family leader peptide-containing protein [Amycolatopsis sp. NBC_00345]